MSGGYEKKDVDVKKLFLVAVIPALTVLLSILVVHYYFSFTQIQEEEAKSAEVDSRWTEMKALSTEQLSSYGVVDASKQRFRIPVDRAKQIILNDSLRSRGALAK